MPTIFICFCDGEAIHFQMAPPSSKSKPTFDATFLQKGMLTHSSILCCVCVCYRFVFLNSHSPSANIANFKCVVICCFASMMHTHFSLMPKVENREYCSFIPRVQLLIHSESGIVVNKKKINSEIKRDLILSILRCIPFKKIFSTTQSLSFSHCCEVWIGVLVWGIWMRNVWAHIVM